MHQNSSEMQQKFVLAPGQGRIQPVSLVGAILVISGSQVSWRLRYCKRDEVYFRKLLLQNMDDKIALYRKGCFPNCKESYCIKFLS